LAQATLFGAISVINSQNVTINGLAIARLESAPCGLFGPWSYSDDPDADTRLEVWRASSMENINMFVVIGVLAGLLATAADVMVSLFALFAIAVAIANLRWCKIA
jgi:hypothetical protein